MFTKLFQLVKNNAGKAVINNPEIAESSREAVITEASSTIIDVLKNHIENGKMKDLVTFFSQNGIYGNPLVNNMVNKFANRLNTYYGIDSISAFNISSDLIPTVMEQLVEETKRDENKEFGLGVMFTQLTGNRADLSNVVNHMLLAS